MNNLLLLAMANSIAISNKNIDFEYKINESMSKHDATYIPHAKRHARNKSSSLSQRQTRKNKRRAFSNGFKSAHLK